MEPLGEQDMTEQAAAEALVKQWMKTCGVNASETSMSFVETDDLGSLKRYIQNALQTSKKSAYAAGKAAGLREAAQQLLKAVDFTGGCVGTENDPKIVAVNRFIELQAVPHLERLADQQAGAGGEHDE